MSTSVDVLAVRFDTDPFIESMVDDEMVNRAIEAYNQSFAGGQHNWMRAALIAALKGIDNG